MPPKLKADGATTQTPGRMRRGLATKGQQRVSNPEGRGASLRAAALVDYVQRKGSDAEDPRDAAHEACHALSWSVRGKWDRDNIHRHKPKNRSEGVGEEILARAVEQLVCSDLEVDIGGITNWAMTCWMEMIKNERIALPSLEWLVDAIKERMLSKTARAMADRVLALGMSTDGNTRE